MTFQLKLKSAREIGYRKSMRILIFSCMKSISCFSRGISTCSTCLEKFFSSANSVTDVDFILMRASIDSKLVVISRFC